MNKYSYNITIDNNKVFFKILNNDGTKEINIIHNLFNSIYPFLVKASENINVKKSKKHIKNIKNTLDVLVKGKPHFFNKKSLIFVTDLLDSVYSDKINKFIKDDTDNEESIKKALKILNTGLKSVLDN